MEDNSGFKIPDIKKPEHDMRFYILILHIVTRKGVKDCNYFENILSHVSDLTQGLDW
jgi:hypothetical protein